MNTNPTRVRPVDALLITLTSLAMLIALSRHANACEPGPRDNGTLSFQGLMMNFNRFMKNPDGLVNQDPEVWIAKKDQVALAVADLSGIVECADFALASKETLLPPSVVTFKPENKALFIANYEKWMTHFKETVLAYQTEMKAILELVNTPNVKPEDLKLDALKSANRLVTDAVNNAHSDLSTSERDYPHNPGTGPGACDSKL
jgi:hypothetical protein